VVINSFLLKSSSLNPSLHRELQNLNVWVVLEVAEVVPSVADEEVASREVPLEEGVGSARAEGVVREVVDSQEGEVLVSAQDGEGVHQEELAEVVASLGFHLMSSWALWRSGSV